MTGAAPVRLAGGDPWDVASLAAMAGPGRRLQLGPAVAARLRAARDVVDRHAAGGAPVYGLNTGLGGNVGHRLQPHEIAAFQDQVVRGRMVGVGPPLPQPVCRLALFLRILGIAQGGTGLSPDVLGALVAMYHAGITPVVPRWGSIGAGDLALCAHLAAPVIGRGEAWLDGERLPGGQALARAGLSPAVLGARDGLGLINASCISVAMAVLALHRCRHLLDTAAEVAALSFEAFAGNPAIFDPRLASARPAAGQVQAAALFRRLLAGSALHDGPPRRIQDALSFRVLAPVLGTVATALDAAVRQTEIEANAAADNPLVLADDGTVLSTANFHTPALALAFDTLAIALCHWAGASAHRTIKLMNPALSGLAKYLSPVGGASNGLNSLQKTAAALHAEVRRHAAPASLDALAVSETVEDVAPQTPLCIAKLADQLAPLGLLAAVEAVVAAQAADLRGARLGAAAASVHARVRAAVPALEQDREPGPDVSAAARALGLWPDEPA